MALNICFEECVEAFQKEGDKGFMVIRHPYIPGYEMILRKVPIEGTKEKEREK